MSCADENTRPLGFYYDRYLTRDAHGDALERCAGTRAVALAESTAAERKRRTGVPHIMALSRASLA